MVPVLTPVAAARAADGGVGVVGSVRPLVLSSCRRLVVVAPGPQDEIRAAEGLLGRLAGRRVEVDLLGLTPPLAATAEPENGEDPDGGDDGWDDLDRGDDGWDDPEGGADPDDVADPDDAAARAAYAALGLHDVRRHRLGLTAGDLAAREADIVAALSEIVGYADPTGLHVLAPWSGGGGSPRADHEVAGRAAEVVCAAYRVRLVRWLDQVPPATPPPEPSDARWRRTGAGAAHPTREVFLV